jgi:hypothetical protein
MFDFYPTLAIAGQIFFQRQRDRADRVPPFASDENMVALVDPAFAQFRVQPGQRQAFFGNQQHARGVAVEAMNEFQKFCIGTRIAQPFNQAKAHTAAAVDGETGGLVERDQRVVFVEGRRNGSRSGQGPRSPLCSHRCADWWHAESITRYQTRIRANAQPVYPNLAAAQDPVDMAFGHALQNFQQVIVDPLPLRLFADYKPVDSILA